MKNDKKYIYVSMILIQSVVYGLGNPLTKIGYESVSVLWLLLVRFVMASALYWIFYGRKAAEALRKYPVSLWLPSALCCAGAYISGNMALQLTTSTNVGFLISLPVLFTPVTTLLILRKGVSVKKIPVIALTVVGLFLLCSNGGFFDFGAGEALALLDSFFVALLLPFGEKAMNEMDTGALTTLQATVTTLIIAAGTLAFDSFDGIMNITWSGFGVAVYLAVTCSFLSYLFQNTAVKHLSSQTVVMLQCTQPVMTAVLSYFILDEKLSTVGIIGVVIITACIVADSMIKD